MLGTFDHFQGDISNCLLCPNTYLLIINISVKILDYILCIPIEPNGAEKSPAELAEHTISFVLKVTQIDMMIAAKI